MHNINYLNIKTKKLSPKSFVVLRGFFVELGVTIIWKLHEVTRRIHEATRSCAASFAVFHR